MPKAARKSVSKNTNALSSCSGAYYKIREGRVHKRIIEMVKAVRAASHAEVLGGRKKR